MKKVVVGLSGGVDSSVAAYLLKQQGYDVTALFMINWHDNSVTLEGDCNAEDEQLIAELVARKLGIPFKVIDLSEGYSQRVVDYMFSEYEKGRTPNPDVLCNREIKFDLFMKAALDLGAEYVATGHYCRKEEIVVDGVTHYRLLAGSDPNKDQSYFLCQLTQNQLSKAMFPVGNLLKPEVRVIADQLNLASAHKKDSQGICFVGKVSLPVFLQQKLKSQKGKIIEIMPEYEAYHHQPIKPEIVTPEYLSEVSRPYSYKPWEGKMMGEHIGAQFFTIGQRKGLNVGGTKEALFVIATDVHKNVVYVGQGQSHPGLYRLALYIKTTEIHWVRPDLSMQNGDSREYLVRIRYRQELQAARVYRTEKGLYILFDEAQRGITAGQFAAWYDGEELVGSGVIAN